MARTPNETLGTLLETSGMSRKALARAVQTAAAQDGVQLATDHTLVGKWLDGMLPRGRTPDYIAQALSTRLGRTVTRVEIGMATDSSSPATDSLTYAEDDAASAQTVAELWGADIRDRANIQSTDVDPPAWREASLHWLIGGRSRPLGHSDLGRKVGMGDVTTIRMTVEHFAELDNRFGGGHGRQALIHYLSNDVAPLLHGRFSDAVRVELFSTVAEATLLAAWSCYDSGLHGLAQRYFIQALRLAQTADDRRLAGSILSAMSHQATFLGHYQEAADLARAALAGVAHVGTATMRAQFHAMEARALARLGSARECDLALGDAARFFDRSLPGDDPAWISYFNEAELAAELGHCLRDLGRPAGVAQHLTLETAQGDGTYVRSDFFATMVIADAHAAAGEAEEAVRVARIALELGEQLKSARCASYLREFRDRLTLLGPSDAARQLAEEAAEHPLWTPAA